MTTSGGSASKHAHDVLVCGGGVVGLACARGLAAGGASVVLADPQPGRGASWAAAGMLAPVTEVHYGEEALLRLNLASSALYPDFAAELTEETGRDIGYRNCGTVMVARDRDDNVALEEVFRFQRELGLTVDRLNGRECREREPALSPRTRGGIYVEGDHQVDNRALVEALFAACRAHGVEVVRSSVRGVASSDGVVTGVELDDGSDVSTPNVLLAAGALSGHIEGLEEARLPSIRPVKGQLLHLCGDAPLVQGNVRGLDVYLVGRTDGRLVVGATVEEQGFDLRITAGAVHDLLRAAYELVPGITELEVVETTAGSRPSTPDNAPLLGRTALDGLTVATGHFRNGVLLAPITADVMAKVILGGESPEMIEPFRPTRFLEQKTSA
jgi:glycine oxidase